MNLSVIMAICFLFIDTYNGYSQNQTDSLLVSMLEISIESYFSESATELVWHKYYFNENSSLPDIKNQYQGFDVEFVDGTRVHEIAKKDSTFELHFINLKLIADDTIDVSIGARTITYIPLKPGVYFKGWNPKIRLKKKDFFVHEIQCGGTMGYIPSYRFTHQNNEWTLITYDELVEERFNKP